jgi:hypothetical protein
MCVSVRGLLHRSNAELRSDMKWITKDGGIPYASVAEFRNSLMDELAKGHEVLPTGECDNFDWKKGCQGHEQA